MTRSKWIVAAALTVTVALAACTAGDPGFTADDPAGFWVGLWHGVISVITLIVGIFVDSVHGYEPQNTGGWYDIGFLIGVTTIWGGGSSRYHHRRRRLQRDKEWEDLSKKVEAKLRRRIRAWADAEPDEEWKVVEHKAEEKLKRKVREWAEAP